MTIDGNYQILHIRLTVYDIPSLVARIVIPEWNALKRPSQSIRMHSGAKIARNA